MDDTRTVIEIDAEVVGSVAEIKISIVAPGAELADHIVNVVKALAANYGTVESDVAVIRHSLENAA